MSKAYNRVEWNFLKMLMQKLGFAERWVSKVMRCVETVKYRIQVNGLPSGFIKPVTGLRQGGPISP